MCGIFLYRGNGIERQFLVRMAESLRPRGPDNTTYKQITNNIFVGHHRLSITDPSRNGNQPFNVGKYVCICNGQIFNYIELIRKYTLPMTESESDCKVLLYLYIHFNENIEAMLSVINGDYAFVIIDKESGVITIARDQFGIRPLFIGHFNGDVCIASELKAFNHIKDVTQFPPNHHLIIKPDSTVFVYIKSEYEMTKRITIAEPLKSIRESLNKSIDIRLCYSSSENTACLLSGGLDSSLIAMLLQKRVTNLKTFSIGQSRDAPDLVAARIVAEYINSDHHEIIVSSKDMFDVIPHVIKDIETYDITTIRASTPMWLLCKYIKTNFPNIKTLFSGEGSDELFGGYAYFKLAPTDIEFLKETNKLMNNIHFYDGLRADRCASSFGMDLRVPFLDKSFANMVYNIPIHIKRTPDIEKKCLRQAFEGLLPEDILYRKKEAFSDGVSNLTNSWYKYIKSKVNETQYYTDIFESHFHGHTNIIPGLWLPNWTTITDPSARELVKDI